MQKIFTGGLTSRSALFFTSFFLPPPLGPLPLPIPYFQMESPIGIWDENKVPNLSWDCE